MFFRAVLAASNVSSEVAATAASKAAEMLRLLNVKIPKGSQALRGAEHVRKGVALELACRDFVEVSQRTIWEMCGVKKQQYAHVFRAADRVMSRGATESSTVVRKKKADLSFVASTLLGGNVRISKKVCHLVKAVLKQRSARRGQDAFNGAFDARAVEAAAFFDCASRAANADIDTKELLRLTAVSAADFKRARDELAQSRVVDDVLQNGAGDEENTTVPRDEVPGLQRQQKQQRAVGSLRARRMLKIGERNQGNLDRAQAAATHKRSLEQLEDLPAIAEEDKNLIEEEDISGGFDDWALATLQRAFPDKEPPPIVSIDSIRHAFDALLNDKLHHAGHHSPPNNNNNNNNNKRHRTSSGGAASSSSSLLPDDQLMMN